MLETWLRRGNFKPDKEQVMPTLATALKRKFMKTIWTLLVLAQSLILSLDLLSQVDGMHDYPKPKYLILPTTGNDPVGALRLWRAELVRVGYQTITHAEQEDLIEDEEQRILLADLVRNAGSQGVARTDLPALVRERGQNWYNGYFNVLNDLLQDGSMETWEEIESRKYFDKKTERIRWADGVTPPEQTLNEPNTFHSFSYRYTYRESLTCGHTFSEIHGAINEVSGDANVPLVPIHYRPGALESNCPTRVIAQLARQMTPTQAAPKPEAEITTNLTANADRVAALSTIVVVPKPGTDCAGLDASQMTDLMSLGLLETFDIVDRSVMELALAEQKLSMSGLIRDEDWLEAGAMAGAGGILTLQAMCLSNQSMLKAKLISSESNLLLLSAIGKEATPEDLAQHIGDAVQAARKAP